MSHFLSKYDVHFIEIFMYIFFCKMMKSEKCYLFFIIIIMLRQQVWIILQTLLFCYENKIRMARDRKKQTWATWFLLHLWVILQVFINIINIILLL